MPQSESVLLTAANAFVAVGILALACQGKYSREYADLLRDAVPWSLTHKISGLEFDEHGYGPALHLKVLEMLAT